MSQLWNRGPNIALHVADSAVCFVGCPFRAVGKDPYSSPHSLFSAHQNTTDQLTTKCPPLPRWNNVLMSSSQAFELS